MTERHDALNDALERFSGYTYFDSPGFAFHGPMGAEALSTLGGDDLVARWADSYAVRHRPLPVPPPQGSLDPDDRNSWRPALGVVARVADWEDLFRRQLADRQWTTVVRAWAPTLLAGHGGGLTHGIIRVAHAVRALEGASGSVELLERELVRGLAYWAATYQPLPQRPTLSGALSVTEALEALPRPAEPWPPMEAGTFARLPELTGFPAAVDAVEAPRSADPLGDLTAAFCRVVLATPANGPIVPLVHAVTPGTAARILQPLLPGVAMTELYAQLWQVGAAVTSSFSRHAPYQADAPRSLPEPADLMARAVAHGDTHAMKLTEACLREHAVRPDPIYLLAAAHVLDALPTWGKAAA